jgi:hypothetical protein
MLGLIDELVINPDSLYAQIGKSLYERAAEISNALDGMILDRCFLRRRYQ